jgi:hypothetical protein
MMMEKFVEWLAGETEVLGENLPQYRFIHHKPHMLPVREPGSGAVGKPATNRLSYGTAQYAIKVMKAWTMKKTDYVARMGAMKLHK